MYVIRDATLNDVEIIVYIAELVWWSVDRSETKSQEIKLILSETLSAENIAADISQKHETYLILINEGIPVAFISYAYQGSQPPICLLHKLYCLPLTQGRGFDRILIEEIARRAVISGCHELNFTLSYNNKSRAYYEKLGFTVADENLTNTEHGLTGLYLMSRII